MSFSSFPLHLDPANRNQLPAVAGAGAGASAGAGGGGGARLASAQAPGVVAAAQPTMSTAKRTRLTKLPPPEQPLRCPRCDSTNTKFCYFNNYSLSQPRHFCKACRRYWTRGGTLRSVPVGGACRRNRSAESTSTSSKPSAHAGVPNNPALNSGGTPTINGATAGCQIELWNLPQVQHLAFWEPAAQQPARSALPHFQAGVDLPPVKMEDHASHLGFNLPRQYSVPPGNYHQHYWSSSDSMKDGSSGGAGGGGWPKMADLYVFDSSSISGFNVNNYA